MIKKIKLYFINRKIKKIQNKISEIQEPLNRIKNHIHDMQWFETLDCIKTVNAQLDIYKSQLDEYAKYKERLMKS